MYKIWIYTFLFSISPFGEARVGIPYGVINNMPFFWAFTTGLIANLMIYPLMMWLINSFSEKLWSFSYYKKAVIWVSKFAKKGAGNKIEKYGFWGLMIFVMIPLPGTGAYMGTIAAAIFKIQPKKAFLAISLGVIISCIILALFVRLGMWSFT
jgi:uncharacterized membrane protein